MKSIIIGTAGHIDHGKTALVKALTGIDADRLEEEKRRGITIDIGFAHLDLSTVNGEKLQLGFVDVPGHERFVRNMLAGIGGIDLVLLVIAADESIKPQTREHFDICRLLSVRRGITVLTKSDLIDSEMLDVVKLEVGEFLRGSFLDPQTSPIIPVSALTGAGLDDLKRALARVAAEISSKDSAALPRLPIDRVFTMKGFGTVVTGTLISGTIRKEDELEVFPSGKRIRVRGVQVHGKPAEQAVAGERTALNLAGVSTEDLARGMVLAPTSTFHSTSRVDVSLSLVPSAKLLKDQARVHFHAYTAETIATVVLLVRDNIDPSHPCKEGKDGAPTSNREPASSTFAKNAKMGHAHVSPGEQVFAQLRLAEPVLLLPGDRFIIRQFSPVITIGGGVVLDASPIPRSRKDSTERFLEILAQGEPESILLARIARRSERGLLVEQAIEETGWRRQAVEAHSAALIANGSIIRVDDLLVHCDAVVRIKSQVQNAVAEFHKQNPLVAGISKEALRGNLDLEIFAAVLDMLVREKKLVTNGEVVHLPGRAIVMKDEEAESKKIIENAFASAGLKVPALRDVLAALKVDKVRAQKIVTLLLREKVLVKISEELVFHRDALETLRKNLAAEKAKSLKIDVARFKDMTGVSRKYAIPLLEYLDRERVTKRVGDERVIL
ncbi:MAG TPA: selenocysteine-specific translation elongation factor [Terriglobales bacterium]|nr:selenocysteine-specific translation elongation factor [Terriglobales bacterium]